MRRGSLPFVALVGLGACSLTQDLDSLKGTGTGGAGNVDAGGDAGASGTGGAAGDAGGLDAGAMIFVDDELDGEFGAGTFVDTAWSVDHVGLSAPSTTGTFRSRVFDAGQEVSWTTIGWLPGAPYGKSLPAAGKSESGYPADNMNMSEIVLLLRFDGPLGALADGAPVPDSSGLANDASVNAGAALVGGQLGQALGDDSSGYAFTPIGAGSGLNFGSSDFTWSLWVKTTESCSSNRVHLGAEDSIAAPTHLWLGCTVSSQCPNGDGTGRAGGTFCSHNDTADDCQGYCGKTEINDGAWHQLVVVKQGHDPGTIRLFVDGKDDLVSPTDTAFSKPFTFTAGTELTVGAFSEGTYQSAGTFDEVAIWRRALSPSEVSAMYRRGRLRLSLQVRVCSQSDCSDAPPFVGPSGATSSYLDPEDELSPPSAVPLQGLTPGRYFQYQASFSGETSPELHSVTIHAAP